MAKHCMIDLETLSTAPNALVLTLGAVHFDPEANEIGEEFYIRLNVEDQSALGRDIDPNTIDWWAKQDQAAQDEAFSDEDRVPLKDAIDQFHKFTKGCSAFWSHGSTFDLIILNDIYSQLNKTVPWNYWQMRDTRTIFDIGLSPNMNKEGLHNALEDAMRQAKGVQHIYAQLRKAGIGK